MFGKNLKIVIDSSGSTHTATVEEVSIVTGVMQALTSIVDHKVAVVGSGETIKNGLLVYGGMVGNRALLGGGFSLTPWAQ